MVDFIKNMERQNLEIIMKHIIDYVDDYGEEFS